MRCLYDCSPDPVHALCGEIVKGGSPSAACRCARVPVMALEQERWSPCNVVNIVARESRIAERRRHGYRILLNVWTGSCAIATGTRTKRICVRERRARFRDEVSSGCSIRQEALPTRHPVEFTRVRIIITRAWRRRNVLLEAACKADRRGHARLAPSLKWPLASRVGRGPEARGWVREDQRRALAMEDRVLLTTAERYGKWVHGHHPREGRGRHDVSLQWRRGM
mmetsp:Transcript_9460/g.27637  ORF Transcript_9460/g.27637 Transcript_9460/m.27637 type:complete len:224 (-) Transcript_9460:8-679(-)